MAEMSILHQRRGIDTLYHTETDTGLVSVQLEFPVGIWELIDVSVMFEADNMAYDKAPGSISVFVKGGTGLAVRRTSILPVGRVSASGGNWWNTTYECNQQVVTGDEELYYFNEDLSGVTGTTGYFYVRARRMR